MNTEQEIKDVALRLNEEQAPWSRTNWRLGFEAGAKWAFAQQPSHAPSGEVMSLEYCMNEVAKSHRWEMQKSSDIAIQKVSNLYAQQFKEKAAALEQENQRLRNALVNIAGIKDVHNNGSEEIGYMAIAGFMKQTAQQALQKLM